MEKTAEGRKEKAVKKQQDKKYALETMMKVARWNDQKYHYLRERKLWPDSVVPIYISIVDMLCQLEQEERDLIKKIKDEEREKATAELEEWKKRQIQTAVEKPPIKVTNNRDKVQTLPQASRGCSGNPGELIPVHSIFDNKESIAPN